MLPWLLTASGIHVGRWSLEGNFHFENPHELVVDLKVKEIGTGVFFVCITDIRVT